MSVAEQRVAPLAAIPTDMARTTGVETAGQFLTAALQEAAVRFSASRQSFLREQSPASVHALRVAARKLRVLISVISKLSPQPQLTALAHEARGQARAVAALRETDVLLDQLQAFFKTHDGGPGARLLVQAVEQQRAETLRQAHAVFTARGPAPVVARLPASGPPAINAAAPGFALTAREAARLSLDGLRRRVKKRARGMNGFGDRERHDLRLALKTLRYGLELFAPLFAADARWQRTLSRVSRLQDRLGQCNDAVAARMALASLASTPGMAEAAEAYLAREDRRAARAARTLKRRTCRLLSTRPVWRG